MTVLLMPRTS